MPTIHAPSCTIRVGGPIFDPAHKMSPVHRGKNLAFSTEGQMLSEYNCLCTETKIFFSRAIFSPIWQHIPSRAGLQELCSELHKHLHFYVVKTEHLCVPGACVPAASQGKARAGSGSAHMFIVASEQACAASGRWRQACLADVLIAFPIYKYEPLHLCFPYPGLSLDRCSYAQVLKIFSYNSSWHDSLFHRKGNHIALSYQTDQDK